ncbi:hypothetical protein R1flu_023923 [Riccia fluitans]|uniref:Uncharacterized protein n=1 Tax=Riccia fluitans TaxID=41844 RepID=A0ABD1XTF5_9MARC
MEGYTTGTSAVETEALRNQSNLKVMFSVYLLAFERQSDTGWFRLSGNLELFILSRCVEIIATSNETGNGRSTAAQLHGASP